MLTHSNSTIKSGHSGKEIEDKDSSSISTMSSVDIGSEDEVSHGYESDYDVKVKGGQLIKEESSGNSNLQSDDHVSKEETIESKAQNFEKDNYDEDEEHADATEENWSLFGDDEEYPMLEDEDILNSSKSVKESHDSSHFVGDSKEQAVHRGESFVIPRPDSSGNFLHTSILKDAPTVSSENGSVIASITSKACLEENKSSGTILSSNNEASSNNSKGGGFVSLGADILMEKSAITGKLTLEDPSQATSSETSHRKSNFKLASQNFSSNSFLDTCFHLNTKFGVLYTAAVLFLSISLTGMFYFKKEHLNLIQEIELLRQDFNSRESELLKNLEDQEHIYRKDMEHLELLHLEELANATTSCQEDVPIFSWEEEDNTNTILDIQNCWVNAQASFEWGLCPRKLKDDIFESFSRHFSTEDHGERTVYSNAMKEASMTFSSWRDNLKDLSKEFANTVLLPDDPKKLLDGSVWTDIIYGNDETKE